jgi:arginase family enzyme
MSTIQEIQQFTAALHFQETNREEYSPTQLGSHITQIASETDMDALDIILVGCGELRGQKRTASCSDGPDKIREELYKLHYWHPEVKIGDLGNIMEGETLADTRAALKTVLSELKTLGKKVVLLGGSHDLTLQQYEVFREAEEIIDFAVIDMLADVAEGIGTSYDDYLMTALTSTPNFVRHFNLIGFQSYYVNPHLIETLDKLRFDCLRVGKARENIEQIEPILRGTHLLSMDINAIRYSDAPVNKMASPNGFFGDEMCKITRFAGMSPTLQSFGIYGYIPGQDHELITAKLIAQMLWYYIDGVNVGKTEASLEDIDQFFEYQITFTDHNSFFLKSKRTNRWWIRLPEGRFIPCSHSDYLTACNNEMPEIWLREMERLVG